MSDFCTSGAYKNLIVTFWEGIVVQNLLVVTVFGIEVLLHTLTRSVIGLDRVSCRIVHSYRCEHFGVTLSDGSCMNLCWRQSARVHWLAGIWHHTVPNRHIRFLLKLPLQLLHILMYRLRTFIIKLLIMTKSMPWFIRHPWNVRVHLFYFWYKIKN